jgi:hypothetical protein
MTEIPDHPVYNKNTLEFITVANDFCLTVSDSGITDKSFLIDYLIKVFPLLYLKAALLPGVEVTNPEMNQRFVTQEEWEILFLKLRKVFGKDDEFWYMDLTGENEDPVKGSLAEHIADIFQDLQDFLLLYQKSSLDAKENALMEVSKSFSSYWGYRLVNAHKILHHYYVRGYDETDQEDPFNLQE